MTLLERVQAYCLSKRGVTSSVSFNGQRIGYNILGRMPTFVWEIAHDENPLRIVIKCYDHILETFPENASIKVSKRISWGGNDWKWVDIWLDGTLSEETLFQLLDDGYQLALTTFDETDLTLIDILERDLPAREVLNELIASNDLMHRREEIEHILDTAIVLHTHAIEEDAILIGQTKMGGSPDLPEGWAYPSFDGRPLAFFAQINLGEIPPAIRKPQLPPSGILYFFSMYGWDDDEAFWFWSRHKENGFSQVLYYDGEVDALKQQRRPEQAILFRAATVEFTQTLSLPRGGAFTDVRDPVASTMDWTEEEFKRLEDLNFDFSEVLYKKGMLSGHRLLGYADPVHYAVTTPETQILLELLTEDENIGGRRGEGGILYFTIAYADLREKNFSTIYSDFHFD